MFSSNPKNECEEIREVFQRVFDPEADNIAEGLLFRFGPNDYTSPLKND